MKEEILKTNLPREKGYLYYTATSEDGMLTIWRTETAYGKKKRDI